MASKSSSDPTVVRRFAQGEVRHFEKGRFEVVELGGVTIGRATYEPGWRWSTHVGARTGEALCHVEHVGMVIEGRAAVSFPGAPTRELSPGDLFYVPPGHDSWVVGDEEYVSLHFLGAESYARE
jgi:quercetin dioxygenase-like cupin family protein